VTTRTSPTLIDIEDLPDEGAPSALALAPVVSPRPGAPQLAAEEDAPPDTLPSAQLSRSGTLLVAERVRS